MRFDVLIVSGFVPFTTNLFINITDSISKKTPPILKKEQMAFSNT
jgi:hypothetical protein